MSNDGSKKLKKFFILGVYSFCLIFASVSLTLKAVRYDAPLLHFKKSDPKVTTSNEEVIKGPVAFYPIRPAFVVNLPKDGKLKRLQVQVDIMTLEQAQALIQLQKYEPLIKSELLKLLSTQTIDIATSPAEQKELRQQALSSLKQLLVAQTGDDYVRQVLFTGFVVE